MSDSLLIFFAADVLQLHQYEPQNYRPKEIIETSIHDVFVLKLNASRTGRIENHCKKTFFSLANMNKLFR